MSYIWGREAKERGQRGRETEGEKKTKKNSPLFKKKTPTQGVSGVAHKSWGKGYEHHAIAVRVMAATMMCLSIFMAGYAAHMFKVRGDMLM